MRSKFARLRQEYNEIVKSFEGESAKVSWKNSYKLCFPTVDHDSSPTEETFDASTDHGKQKNISKATEKKLNCLNTSELFEETRPVQICVDESSKTTDKEAQDMSDGDFECIDKLNNSTATNDCCKSTKKITSKDSVNLNGMEFHPPSNPTGTNTVSVMNSGSQTLSNTETAQEISTDSTVNGKERNDGPANEGRVIDWFYCIVKAEIFELDDECSRLRGSWV